MIGCEDKIHEGRNEESEGKDWKDSEDKQDRVK